MLEVAKIHFSFVDTDTGEVLGKYSYQKANDNGNPVDVESFVTNKLLSSYVSSFIRGCFKRRNIILQIDFTIEKIF